MVAGSGLAGRVVVVTGGLGRLGSSFARALIAGGARVAIIDAKVNPKRPSTLFAGVGDDKLRIFEGDVVSRPALERIRAGRANGEKAARKTKQPRRKVDQQRAASLPFAKSAEG